MNGSSPEKYCAFCGLPVPAGFALGSVEADDLTEYCCSGCRTVADVTRAQAEQGSAATALLRLGLGIFFAMNVMVFAMALWSQDVYAEEAFATPLAVTLRGVFRWAALVFALPVLYLLGGPIATGVWQSLRRGGITTDLLILLGVGAAYAYSVVSVLRGSGHVYFEVSSMVLVFVSLGRWLEVQGKLRTNESLDALTDLLPKTVRRLTPEGTFQEAARQEVVTGDVLRVLPGERFPVDGVVVMGQALVDEQMVTGESRSVERSVGARVASGTLNLDGDLRITVTAADGQETVSRILKLVQAARRAKGRHEKLADRIAVWFIPTVCAIAIAAGWWHGRLEGWDEGILAALAVALIACPCALGLATPLAVWTALGRAARGGVLFRSGMALERLAEVRYVCFDKTGTLTTGVPQASELVVAANGDRRQVLEIAATMAAGSTHHLSQAVARFAEEAGACGGTLEPVVVQTRPGRGLVSDIPELGRVVFGNRRLLEDEDWQWPVELQIDDDKAMQAVVVGWSGQVRGVFRFREQLRPEAQAALDHCRRLELDLRILTGDARGRAKVLGEHFGLPTDFELLPEEKVETLESLAHRGRVAMVGDGLNDAPALAKADVGVALGCGADVSRDAAEVCLLANDLQRFPWAVDLARKTVRTVKQNMVWAFSYNAIGIGLAATGRLNPLWAAAAMAISSLFVITNSLRLSRYPEPIFSPAAKSESPTEATRSHSDKPTIAHPFPLASLAR